MALPTIEVGDLVTADLLGTFPAGVIAFGNRTTNKAFTTITGYLRVDGVPLLNGRTYMITAQNIRLSITAGAAANDHYKFDLRYDGTGAAATTASTEIGRCEITSDTNADDDSAPIVVGWVYPSADATGSFLLSATRVTGAATCEVQADSGGIWLTVFDMGVAASDTGVDV